MARATGRILIVVTSHDTLGDTGRRTGFYYEELAAPYNAFTDAGYEVDIASIRGGEAPFDPTSLSSEGGRPPAVDRFLNDRAAVDKIERTLPIDRVDAADYDAVFLPGGHGTMWDLPTNAALARLIEAAFRDGKVIGAVCHGVAGLLSARAPDGTPLVMGRRVNAFTDAEEEAVGLTEAVPFLLESRLRELGAAFEGGPNFQAYVIRDGNLVTGQNPQSSAVVAEEVLAALRDQGLGTPRLRQSVG